MKVSLQTPNYCFETKFNSSAAAKAVVDSLPIDSKVSVEKYSVYFHTDIKVPCGQATDIVNPGDVVYSVSNGSIFVYFSPVKLEKDKLGIIIGRTQIDPVAIGRIRADDPIHVMFINEQESEQKSKTLTSDPSSSRKLTQEEIDILVQKILAQKQTGQG